MTKVALTFTVIFGFLSPLPVDAGTREDGTHKDRIHNDRDLKQSTRTPGWRHPKRYAKKHPQPSAVAVGGDPAWLGPLGTAVAPTTGNWNVALNWDPGVPVSSNLTVLDFGGSGATAYTSTNDIASLFTFGTMSLDSTATATAIIAGSSFNINGSQIVQINSGAFTIENSFDNSTTNATTTLTLTGNGTGLVTLSGVISEKDSATTVSLVKTGTSTFVLSGANTYSGGTTVLGGTLLVNNTTGSGTGTGAVTVNNSGTVLGGTGTIGGAVTINGGANITGATNGTVGVLTLSSTATFTGASGSSLATYLVDISGATSDRLTLSGALNLSNTFDQITFNGSADGTSTYVLSSYSSVSGTFDNVINLPSGYALSYGATELDLVPIPEPSTWIGGSLALTAIALTQRRRLYSRRLSEFARLLKGAS